IFLLAALLGVSSIQAVVVGGPQQLVNNNRNGYRYNGPAHKYLPAEETHQEEQQQQQQQGHPQSFNGPFNKEYYEGQRQKEQQEENSWQSAFAQQHQQQQHHLQQHYLQQHYLQQQHHLQQQPHHHPNQISSYQPHQESSYHYQGLAHQQGHHQEGYNSYQQQQEQQHHQQISGSHHNEHSYESGQDQQHHQGLGQQNHHYQQGQEGQGGPGVLGGSWNSNQQLNEYNQQRGESWQQGSHGIEPWNSNRGHNKHSQQLGGSESWPGSAQSQHYGHQHHHHHGDSLWHPIQEHELEKLPTAEAHASSQKILAKPSKDVKLVPTYTLSSDAEHDRFIGLDSQDNRLLTQGLPSAYRKHTFASPVNQQLSGSASSSSSGKDYLQMQSHSYQLPSTHSTHREWPQQERGPSSSYSPLGGNRQFSVSAYAQSSPAIYSTSPSSLSTPPSYPSTSPASFSTSPSY
ncbi:hypothetical protein KR054_009018, partial [Drosophila jambulina]